MYILILCLTMVYVWDEKEVFEGAGISVWYYHTSFSTSKKVRIFLRSSEYTIKYL